MVTHKSKADSRIKHEHRREDGNVVFTGTFSIDAPPERVLGVLYDFDHLTRFMTIAASVELLNEGEAWQEVQYTYRVLFLRITAKFRRVLKEAENEIRFQLIESRQNIPWFPHVSSYRGHYHMHPEDGGCVVEYHQEIRLAPQISSWLFPYRGRKQLVEFLASMKRYLDGVCASGGDN